MPPYETVYAKEPFPTDVTSSIFLAGPTPRSTEVKSWRQGALNHLTSLGFNGHVFLPEPRDGNWFGDYEDQIEWEEEALHRADCIVFWVPRDLGLDSKGELKMPGFTTNAEWGEWKVSGKVLWGAPRDAAKIRYEEAQASTLGVPKFRSLISVLEEAVLRVGKGARRSAGEAQVPLHIWRTRQFQDWYATLKSAGNKLVKFRQIALWPRNKDLFFWWANTQVYIEKEARLKEEPIFVRMDLSVVVLYKRDEENWLNTQLVLVREHRPAVRNVTGYVWEPPGGSSKKPTTPVECAIKEVWEETGLQLEAPRLRVIGSRQCYATMSTHVAHVFAAEVTDDEMVTLRAKQGVPQGEEGTAERVLIEVKTVQEVIAEGLVDWTMMGAILMATVEVPE